jgi:hypothetical protein
MAFLRDIGWFVWSYFQYILTFFVGGVGVASTLTPKKYTHTHTHLDLPLLMYQNAILNDEKLKSRLIMLIYFMIYYNYYVINVLSFKVIFVLIIS